MAIQAKELRDTATGIGSVCFATGAIVIADYIIAVNTAYPPGRIGYNIWVISTAAVLMMVGIWALLAAHIQRLWLPGRKGVKDREAIRKFVVATLATFHGRAVTFTHSQWATINDLDAWLKAACDFVEEAFGPAERVALIHLGKQGEDGPAPRGFRRLAKRMATLIERIAILEVNEDFHPTLRSASSWFKYLENDHWFDEAQAMNKVIYANIAEEFL
jgi:hypothetical protein